MAIATNLGFSRMGAHRELKKALERFWGKKCDATELLATARALRQAHWALQRDAGLSQIPCNDFSLYDHVLDAALTVGVWPERFAGVPEGLDRYFAMARGVAHEGERSGVAALEMTKWFDTNYHYLVPEFEAGQKFTLDAGKPIQEFAEAKALGVPARPVLLGPLSFLLLGKAKNSSHKPLELWPALLPVYEDLLRQLRAAGADWVQLDEPCLATDLEPACLVVLDAIYRRLADAAGNMNILLATYFGELKEALPVAMRLPVRGVHLDLVRGLGQLQEALELAAPGQMLSLGLIDGRNIWRTDLLHALAVAESAAERLGVDRVMIAPSCSLLHVPYGLEGETKLDAELKSWLAFGRQKLEEVSVLARALEGGRDSVADALEDNRKAISSRRSSPRTHVSEVRSRLAAVTPAMFSRSQPYSARRAAQREKTPLPLLPTTTIGSFPQTEDVRKARALFKAGKLPADQYDAFLKEKTAEAVRWQEEVGLDVLVHGEFERNDMVEYFGENLDGFAFTENGWVQSYGSRCVKPPIIFGDVARRGPMTVEWSRYAQSLTGRPMKGMLTGPVTILLWSFVRDDQPRRETCWQIALAIRDEVADLEKVGIGIIQIDEPALREGLPLRRAHWDAYLRWAVECFRLAAGGAADQTQIHTHMCYCEFNDIMPSIAALDADVISIETSRSQMELLEAFSDFRYPNEIGPGVYDIHSPRCPHAVSYTHVGGVRRLPLSERNWAGGVRHPLTARSDTRGCRVPAWQSARRALARATVGEPRLRPEDAPLGGGEARRRHLGRGGSQSASSSHRSSSREGNSEMISLFQAELSPGCVTGVGSLPFHDPDEAVEFVAEHCPELPFWPQLPRREAGEGVIGQGMGSLIEHLELSNRPYCWRVRNGAGPALEAALQGGDAGLSPETAAGFFALERAMTLGRFRTARAVKAQMEGPATIAHCLLLDGKPVARIRGWLERLAGFLERQAVWQVKRLGALGLPVLFMLDEPALALVDDLGAMAPHLASALERVLEAARHAGAIVGIHCCAPLPLSLLAGLELDVLSFDAHLAIAEDGFVGVARDVLSRGGRLAFGLAPTGPSSATAESLESRWLALASLLGDPRAVAAQSFVTATCGLGLSTVAETRDSFALARRLASSVGSYTRSSVLAQITRR